LPPTFRALVHWRDSYITRGKGIKFQVNALVLDLNTFPSSNLKVSYVIFNVLDFYHFHTCFIYCLATNHSERVLGDKEYQALENVNTGDQYSVWWNDPGAAAESCARERACDHDHDNEVLFKAAWVMRSTFQAWGSVRRVQHRDKDAFRLQSKKHKKKRSNQWCTGDRREASDHDNEEFLKAAWVMRSTFQA